MATIDEIIANTKNRRQQQHISGKQAQVKALGGKKKGGPSILSRVFDVLSRPLYAVNEPLARASEHAGTRNPRKGKNVLADIAGGFAGGLAGKNKTDFSKTLLRAAEASPNTLLSPAIRENRGGLRSIAGLVGNVGLDPLTYTGTGLLRSVGKETAEAAGMKIGRASVDTAENVQKALSKAEAAKQSRIARGPVQVKDKAAPGGKRIQTAEEVVKKADQKAQTVIRSEQKQATRQAVQTAEKETARIIAENTGKVQLKFAGKTVASSEKLYKGGQTVKDAIKGTEAGKWLGEAFQTGTKFPGLTKGFKRVAELKGVAQADEGIRAMRKFFKPLSEDDLILISHTIEKGSDAITQMERARPELAPFLQEGQRAFKAMGADEVNKGVFRAARGKSADDFLLDNYVYHWYEGGNKKAREQFKNRRREYKAVGPETPGFTQQRTLPTLDEAKAAGLKPEERIDNILARRIGKHHQALARANYVDSVVKEYGTEVGSKAASQMKKEGMALRTVDSPYVPKGTVFPEHVAQSIEALEKMHVNDDFYNQFLKVFDGAQSYWKFGATTLNPGHHIRNMIGDGFNNFLDGVTNPERYRQAFQAIFGKDDGFKIKTKFGYINRAKLDELIVNNGAKSGFVGAELLQGAPANMARGVMGKANLIAGKREEYMRTAHFIDALIKESRKAKTLDEAAAAAGASVRKWNLDYGDLTDWERSVMKRMIPFYTWSRKNLPLQIEAMAMRPGRIAAIPKGQQAIETLMGTEGEYAQFGDLDNVPKFIKEMAPIRLRGEGQGKNAIYWSPGLPFQDIAKYTEGGEQGVFQSLVSQLTPAARIPFEKATGKQTFSGSNVPGNIEFMSQQNPILRNVFNMVTGKQKPASLKTLNYLTGLGVHEVTPNQVSGELGRQQKDLQSQLRSLREGYRKK